jgi:hypothetical protein
MRFSGGRDYPRPLPAILPQLPPGIRQVVRERGCSAWVLAPLNAALGVKLGAEGVGAPSPQVPLRGGRTALRVSAPPHNAGFDPAAGAMEPAPSQSSAATESCEGAVDRVSSTRSPSSGGFASSSELAYASSGIHRAGNPPLPAGAGPSPEFSGGWRVLEDICLRIFSSMAFMNFSPVSSSSRKLLRRYED